MLRAGLAVGVALMSACVVWGAPPEADRGADDQAIEQEQAELKALAARLNQQGAALKNQEQELIDRKGKLEDAGKQLQAERQSLEAMESQLAQASQAIDRDKASRYAVTVLGQTRYYGPSIDEINRKVDLYNQILQQHRARVAAYYEKQKKYQDVAQSLRASIDQLAAGFEEHRAGVDSYGRRSAKLRTPEKPRTINVKEAMAAANKTAPPATPPKPSGQTGDRSKKIIFDDTVPGKHVK